MTFYAATRNRETNGTLRMCILSGAFLFFFAAAAVFLAFSGGSNPPAPPLAKAPEPTEATVEILVPASEIGENQLLHAGLFHKQEMPLRFFRGEMLQNPEEVENRYAKTLFPAGLPVYRTQLAVKAATNDIRDIIPPGYRAVTIKVDKITSVNSWVRPGSRVDVVSITTRDNVPTLIPLVQDVEILSVERRRNPREEDSAEPPTAVTILLIPDDANTVQLAQENGRLSLQLRGAVDQHEIADVDPIKITDIGQREGEKKDECENEFSVGSAKFCFRDNHIVQKQTN